MSRPAKKSPAEIRELARRDDLRQVLDLPAGRRFLAQLIADLRGGALWVSSAEIHARTARHDVGAELDAEILTHHRKRHRQMVAERMDLEDHDHEQLMSAKAAPNGDDDGRDEG